jgi:hypothetical protein
LQADTAQTQGAAPDGLHGGTVGRVGNRIPPEPQHGRAAAASHEPGLTVRHRAQGAQRLDKTPGIGRRVPLPGLRCGGGSRVGIQQGIQPLEQHQHLLGAKRVDQSILNRRIRQALGGNLDHDFAAATPTVNLRVVVFRIDDHNVSDIRVGHFPGRACRTLEGPEDGIQQLHCVCHTLVRSGRGFEQRDTPFRTAGSADGRVHGPATCPRTSIGRSGIGRPNATRPRAFNAGICKAIIVPRYTS